MVQRRIVFQMDPPHGLNVRSDSSVMLMEEAINRGDACYYIAPESLAWENGSITARAQRMYVAPAQQPWYRLEEAVTLDLSTVDAVLIRQDPPFDLHYITATYMLEMLPSSVRVLNPPAILRSAPEKLSVLAFAAFTPPTLITEDIHAVYGFVAKHASVVAKPLYGFGGHGVYVFHAGDANLQTFLEQWNLARGGALVWQAFLPDVNSKECRILCVGGDVAACFTRLPAAGSIRSNMRVGGTPAPHILTSQQHACMKAVGAWLKDSGVMLAGVDMIGDRLIEINITSPTGLRAAQSLYGNNLAATFWDAVFPHQSKAPA